MLVINWFWLYSPEVVISSSGFVLPIGYDRARQDTCRQGRIDVEGAQLVETVRIRVGHRECRVRGQLPLQRDRALHQIGRVQIRVFFIMHLGCQRTV